MTKDQLIVLRAFQVELRGSDYYSPTIIHSESPQGKALLEALEHLLADEPRKTLTQAEWARLLKLMESERSWTEAELLDAIKDGGWMEQQEKEYAENRKK